MRSEGVELKWPCKLVGTVGEPVSTIALSHYSSAEGCFSWKNPDVIISDDFHGFGVYWMVFTPSGASSYTDEMAVIVVPLPAA